jgi:hypothetical protein
MALKFRGLDVTAPVNRIAAGFAAVCVNVRAYLTGGFQLRNLLTDAILTVSNAIQTIARLNDSTPNGPPSGYSLIIANGTKLTVWNSTLGVLDVATGLSGHQVSMVPFRPNASVQVFMYVADSAAQGAVTLTTQRLYDGSPTTFVTNGMSKIRSDGVIWKMGIKEPQLAPVVSTENTNKVTTGDLLATAIPWTNYLGQNPSYNFGESNGFPDPTPDGTAPFAINVLNASFITITALTGSATINGGTKTPTSLGPGTGASTNPGHFVMVAGSGLTPPATATVVIGAFTDGSGNVIPAGVAPLFVPAVVDVGAVIGVSNAIQVPFGAVSFQIGINSTGNTFSANSGNFSLTVTVTTDALPTKTSILGNLTVVYFPDSPFSGPVSEYIWKNPSDPGGSGPARTSSQAAGSTSGNSFIFDATFTAGIPALPGIGSPTVPMIWTNLSPESVAIGGNAVYQPALKGLDGNIAYANFNFCLTGSIYIPAPGNYTFVLTSHDDCIWGIGADASLVSATAINQGGSVSTGLANAGQTISVVSGLPLLPRGRNTSGSGGDFVTSTVVVHFATAGIKPIEIDYDYWFHSGRILLLDASPTPGAGATIIPPLPINVRQEVQYRYVYRSSATGALSNPSPESTAETIPVTANTITSLWSNDPQVDVVDYYRIDSATADFTYVGTGPNDDLGTVPGTNTPITDSLTDLELGTQLLEEDNFEPFPSIDLPQKGVVNVSGGVITWISGGAIGGSATGFNLRWLAGTTILIGSPTSLAYEFIARPTSTTSVTIPGVPDGTNLAYEIPEPILAAQPLPYLFGPTDNINFTFAVGDPLRPGTLYWCKGSNLDSAPDTNQQDVTDPGEPLVNGAMSGGRGVLFSIKRAWVIMPNFYNALSTATGTQGSQWTLQATSIDRGLFIPRCLCVEGGGNIFFRVDDGWHVSPGGLQSQSITDATLYPLFTHEGSTPVPIVRNGITIYPPDDSQPDKQQARIINGYMYWDYVWTDNVPRTLVFDIQAMGWVWDLYGHPVTSRATNEDIATQGTLVGCADGTVRKFASSGTEFAIATVLTPAFGGRGYQHIGELTVEYKSNAPVTLTIIAADADNGSYGPAAITLPSTGGAATKFWMRPGPNKGKWFWLQFQSTDPTMQIYLDGMICYVKEWGSESPYKETQPFASTGGAG